MRKMALCLASLALIACSKNSSSTGGGAPAATVNGEQVGAFGYNFSERQANGQECTTGLRNFQSLDEMCLNIQDPVGNNNCALGDRVHKFVSECFNSRYRKFYESRACNVTLLKPEATPTSFGEYNPADEVWKGRYCVGHATKDIPLHSLDFSGYVHEDVSLHIKMQFVPEHEETETRRSSCEIELTGANRNEGSRPSVSCASGTVLSATHGTLSNRPFKYAIKCTATWACD